MNFVETPNFTRAISKLLSHDEYMRLQNALLQMPGLGKYNRRWWRYQEVSLGRQGSRQEWRSESNLLLGGWHQHHADAPRLLERS